MANDLAVSWLDVFNSFAPLIVALLVAYASFKTSRLTDKTGTYKDIVEKVCFPVFSLVEPNLYKRITVEEAKFYANSVLRIIEESPMLANPIYKWHIKQLLYSNESNCTYRFKAFCLTVDREYDKYCKIVGLPLRSLEYRLNYEQYANKRRLVMYCIAYIFNIAWLPLTIYFTLTLQTDRINKLLEQLLRLFSS